MKRENFFREKLFNHTMPVREGLWDAIEAQLPAKKDQRIFPLFWFTLFSATLLGGVLMLGVFNQKHLNRQSAAPQQTSIADASNADTETQNAQQVSPSTNQSIQESNTTSSTDDIANTPSLSNTKNNSTNQPLSQKNNKSTGRNQNKPIVKSKSGTSSTSISLSSSMEGSSNSENTSSTVAAESSVSNRSLSDHSIIDFLPQQDVYLETEESEMTTLSLLKPDPNCYKFSGTGNKLVLSADVFGGPGFSPKSYTHTENESSVYADARKVTENNQYAWTIGARVNLQHRSGFTGRIGINYTQVGDLFDYTDSLATQSTTVTDSFFAADGTFLYTETSQKLILGTLIKKIHNTYKYVDIPLILGYEMPMGRSTILVNAGPVFNLTSSHEGQILDPNLHPRSITEGDAGAIDVYKTNIGMSLYLGAGYLFPISDQFSGLIEPTFIYRLNPVTLDSYPLQEHRHYAGLNVGIRYHFH